MYYRDYTIYYIQDLDVNPNVNHNIGWSYGCADGQGYIRDKGNQN